MNDFCPYCGRKDHGFACAGLLGIAEPPSDGTTEPAKTKPAPGNEPVTSRKRPRLHKRG